MVDRVQALKLEDPTTGGTETDLFSTATDPNEDFIDARGVTHQNTTSDDDSVRSGRDASDNLTLQDPVTGIKTLAELAAAGGSDEKVKVSVDDTTNGFLNGKLVAGSGITLTEQNPGANESLRVDAFNRTINVSITTPQNVSGGPVDGSGGGHTITAAEAGDWLVWWEGWYSSGANAQLECGIAKNNPATPLVDSLRRSEVDSGGDPLNFGTTAVLVGLIAGDVIYGTANDIATGTVDLQTRRLLGIKVA